jgi:hypothetical protein
MVIQRAGSEGTVMSSGQRLTNIVSVRFTKDEVSALRGVAEGATLSRIVRELCLEALAQRGTSVGTNQTWSAGSSEPFSLEINSPAWTGPTPSSIAIWR